MRYMKMSFVVSETKLPLVLQVLKGEFRNLEVMEVQPEAGATARAPRTVNRPAKMTRTMVMACEWLWTKTVGETVRKDGLSDVLEAKGFNRKSASPLFSELSKAGLLKRLGGGAWEVVGMPKL